MCSSDLLIILAGGKSHRFRSNLGKPYQKIAGKSLIEINVIKARKFKQIKKIVLVYNKKDLKLVKSLKLNVRDSLIIQQIKQKKVLYLQKNNTLKLMAAL